VSHYRKNKSVPAAAAPTPIAPRGLRVAEAASYTGMTVCAIRAAIKNGTLPALRLGKRDIVLREDADAYLSKLREKAAA